jgi:hypothetical protein
MMLASASKIRPHPESNSSYCICWGRKCQSLNSKELSLAWQQSYSCGLMRRRPAFQNHLLEAAKIVYPDACRPFSKRTRTFNILGLKDMFFPRSKGICFPGILQLQRLSLYLTEFHLEILENTPLYVYFGTTPYQQDESIDSAYHVFCVSCCPLCFAVRFGCWELLWAFPYNKSGIRYAEASHSVPSARWVQLLSGKGRDDLLWQQPRSPELTGHNLNLTPFAPGGATEKCPICWYLMIFLMDHEWPNHLPMLDQHRA